MLVLPNWKNYSNTADSCVQNYIMSLKYEYNKITSDQVNKMLLHFEIGDKPNKLQLRGSYASISMHSIADNKGGKLLTNPKDIINLCRVV